MMDSNSNLDSNFFESPMKYVEWKIRNFFDLPTQDNYEMRSPQFSWSGTNWYLRVHPNGHIGNKSLNWISMYLVKKYSSVKYFVNFKMGIRKADGSILKAIDLTYEFPMTSKRYGEAKFIERSFLELSDGALDKNGTLTVFCTVQIENQSPRLRYLETASQTSIIPTLEAESQTSIVSTLEAESQTSIISTLEAESQTSIIWTLEAESQTSIISALEAESKTLESFNVNSACWPPTDEIVNFEQDKPLVASHLELLELSPHISNPLDRDRTFFFCRGWRRRDIPLKPLGHLSDWVYVDYEPTYKQNAVVDTCFK